MNRYIWYSLTPADAFELLNNYANRPNSKGQPDDMKIEYEENKPNFIAKIWEIRRKLTKIDVWYLFEDENDWNAQSGILKFDITTVIFKTNDKLLQIISPLNWTVTVDITSNLNIPT